MRRDRYFKDLPISKPTRPRKVDIHWVVGLSNRVRGQTLNLARKVPMVKKMKKIAENPRLVTIK